MIINGIRYSKEQLSSMIDYAALSPNTTESTIREACKLAKEYRFRGFHPNPYWVPLAASELEGTNIETGIVISFPFGANPTSFKTTEAAELIKTLNGRPGCIDMVTNIGRIKDKDYKYYTNDIAEVVKIGHAAGLEVKSILEVQLLTDDEIKIACHCAVEAGVDFVKTSSGFNGSPQLRHVRLMKESIPNGVGIKYAGFGSISSNDQAELVITAIGLGATRFGTRLAPEIIDSIEKYYINSTIDFTVPF